ncbi:hypothetical protein [Hyphomicrobium sp.]|uniref:hypothetical protein n=1 Tax=Hyphomicrobium sp. TaxID=82 RepID=UPI002C846CD0|nr:hypothetical protein [Hyphomicrobium sp.]HRN88444.1 hypothetical protein [Hyphomicrobium sp.]HRQ26595.1 hypothetical protein [Hyphomicrobium sp.]
MTRIRLTNAQRKHLPDLVAGLAIMALLLALIGWHIGIVLGVDGSVVAGVDWNASMALLAVAFIAMTVFNMAFFRHLSRVRAQDRQRTASLRARQSSRRRGA